MSARKRAGRQLVPHEVDGRQYRDWFGAKLRLAFLRGWLETHRALPPLGFVRGQSAADHPQGRYAAAVYAGSASCRARAGDPASAASRDKEPTGLVTYLDARPDHGMLLMDWGHDRHRERGN